jgi:hypothetical protein
VKIAWYLKVGRQVASSDRNFGTLAHRNTAFHDGNVMGTPPLGGGGVAVCGFFLYNCKLDLHVLQGNFNCVAYRDNVLNAHVVPHFDNHALADRPIFMDDNAKLHIARIVREFRQQEAIDTFQWPAISPDMHPNRARMELY